MKTILFADDHRSIRDYCRRELEDEGYRVVLARDAAEAVEAVRRERPDAVILDICMPQGGGLSAIEQIKQLAPALPVVFFTANDELCLSDRRSCLASACVEKAADLTELKHVVFRLLSSKGETAAGRLGLPAGGATEEPRQAMQGG